MTPVTGQHIPTAEDIRHRKLIKRGIQFCLLVLGESGIGKSTFINNLCNRNVFEENSTVLEPDKAHLEPGLEMVSRNIQLHENNSTPISLDLVMFPGLGDNIDNECLPNQVVDYLETQFEIVLSEESKIKRHTRSVDTRPHACLYFIRPTSKGLREFDVQLMKELGTRVNIIPVISKADLLTEEELKLNKTLILKDINANKISIYDFCDDELGDVVTLDDDEGNKGHLYSNTNNSDNHTMLSTKIKDVLPFSIVSSNKAEIDDNGNVTHIREYYWGTVRVEDTEHCDFIYLKNILFGSHLQEFKDHTHNVLYEDYRTKRLTASNEKSSGSNTFAKNTPLKNGFSYSSVYNNSLATKSGFRMPFPGDVNNINNSIENDNNKNKNNNNNANADLNCYPTNFCKNNANARINIVPDDNKCKNDNNSTKGNLTHKQRQDTLLLKAMEEKDKLILAYKKRLDDLQDMLKDNVTENTNCKRTIVSSGDTMHGTVE
ncbi:septin SPR28 SCDLUD_001900 [Saccharomycodes ludwigii]|uniref:septin SPR28 n=1 Tax=Saccharomycodes ludwigii TaxID=36035 RepID=UPI001E82FD1C|nr:hypothetical protein SCDLUD_001900 [Saccharomycodes ludwigii]KAH3902087.1 hypothetical protein SCDLUD_001900 [Saccharomycodes ludwigii]